MTNDTVDLSPGTLSERALRMMVKILVRAAMSRRDPPNALPVAVLFFLGSSCLLSGRQSASYSALDCAHGDKVDGLLGSLA
jgi:hypothetical protein